MAEKRENEGQGLEGILGELTQGLGEILREQRAQGQRLGKLEERLDRIEGGAAPGKAARGGGRTYDYRVLLHERRYVLKDEGGRLAEMVSNRRCLATRELAEVRTRYHTGSGDRKARYAYRALRDARGDEPGWTPLEYRIDKGAGADYSAYLALPGPVREGELFELRHELELHDAFTSRNEWVTLVVEYPTESFRMEVLLPPGRKLLGARREESEGASNSFNKRRVYPKALPGTGQVLLQWEERRPVTGRAYTLFWDW